MEINLCYVKGICPSDNMYFNSASTRDTYFDNHIIATIDSTYYPPYYKNRIKLELTDITAVFNYLYITYNNIRYYYFVNNIEYVSEDVISIDIIIDAYQTFFPYAEWHYAFVEREFINRWKKENDTWYINRFGYKREAPNAGDNQVVFKKIFYKGSDFNSLLYRRNECPIYVVKRPFESGNVLSLHYEDYPDTAEGNTIPSIDASGLEIGTLSDNSNMSIRFNTSSGTWGDEAVYAPLNELAGFCYYAGTQDIFVFPYGIQKVYTATESVAYAYLYQKDSTLAKGSRDVNTLAFNAYVYGENHFPPYNISALFYYLTNDFPDYITFNTNPVLTSHLFSYKDVPCLWDENYINITFGDVNVYSTLPLYYTKGFEVTCGYLPVLFTGARVYWFEYQSDYNLSTAAINTDPIKMSMVKDPDKDWFTNNKGTIMSIALTTVGTIVGAIAGNAPGAMVGGAMGGAGGKALDAATDTYTFPSASTIEVDAQATGLTKWSAPRYPVGSPTTLPSRVYTSRDVVDAEGHWHEDYLDTASSDIPSTVGFKAPSPNRLVSAAIRSATEVVNTIGMPPQTRSVGLYSTDALTSAHYARVTITASNNLQAAAMFYHLNGYKTDRLTYNSPLIECNTRVNYFIIKLHECDVTFNILVPESMQTQFKRIFLQGVRLWKGDYPTSTISLDNTELAYLEE